MTLDNVNTILNDAITTIIITSLPSVGMGLVVGLIIALFQAVTQVQEQTLTFVPKMIESGQPGHVINTSSGDGGFAPVPMASVYASSKAAVSCFTEALNHQLLEETDNMGASVFYPSGGLMNTGLFTSQRNRPKELERVRGGTGRKSMSFEELKSLLEKAGRDVKVADLDEMGEFVVAAVKERRYIIGRDLDDTVELLHRRANAIADFLCPPHHEMGI